MKRYGFQTGYLTKLEVQRTVSGPLVGHQVPQSIRDVLAHSQRPVEFVVVVYKDETGADRFDCYNELSADGQSAEGCDTE